MKLPAGTASLPPLYADWMSDLLQGPIPAEHEASCQDCPMCSPDRSLCSTGVVFHAKSKCCTYWPDLPNYLAGRILSDDSPEMSRGRTAFEAQFNASLVLTPLGVYPPSSYNAFYKQNIAKFGQEPGMRCPYYLEPDGGQCGIWKHRNSRCATWFCRYVRGSVGVIFWKYLDQLLSTIQKELARWCILQLEIGEEALENMFPPPPSERSLTNWKLLWGKWYGQEREFYAACGQLVSTLSWKEVQNLIGTEGTLAARLVHQNYQKLITEDFPDYLKLGQWKKLAESPSGICRIWSYNQYHPLDLPKQLFDALPLFESCSREQAVRQIRNDCAVPFDDDQLRRLIDFGILQPRQATNRNSIR